MCMKVCVCPICVNFFVGTTWALLHLGHMCKGWMLLEEGIAHGTWVSQCLCDLARMSLGSHGHWYV